MANHVLYIKAANYGEDGLRGLTLDGKPIPGHHGGIMICPRDDCGSPLTVAQEQIEHIGSPCSIGHVSQKLGRMSTNPMEPRAHCGAHFVTGDPEEERPTYEWPENMRWLLEEFTSKGVEGSTTIATVWRRPITWHGDV